METKRFCWWICLFCTILDEHIFAAIEETQNIQLKHCDNRLPHAEKIIYFYKNIFGIVIKCQLCYNNVS